MNVEEIAQLCRSVSADLDAGNKPSLEVLSQELCQLDRSTMIDLVKHNITLTRLVKYKLDADRDFSKVLMRAVDNTD